MARARRRSGGYLQQIGDGLNRAGVAYGDCLSVNARAGGIGQVESVPGIPSVRVSECFALFATSLVCYMEMKALPGFGRLPLK
jgi:hypothetical protein